MMSLLDPTSFATWFVGAIASAMLHACLTPIRAGLQRLAAAAYYGAKLLGVALAGLWCYATMSSAARAHAAASAPRRRGDTWQVDVPGEEETADGNNDDDDDDDDDSGGGAATAVQKRDSGALRGNGNFVQRLVRRPMSRTGKFQLAAAAVLLLLLVGTVGVTAVKEWSRYSELHQGELLEQLNAAAQVVACNATPHIQYTADLDRHCRRAYTINTTLPKDRAWNALVRDWPNVFEFFGAALWSPLGAVVTLMCACAVLPWMWRPLEPYYANFRRAHSERAHARRAKQEQRDPGGALVRRRSIGAMRVGAPTADA